MNTKPTGEHTWQWLKCPLLLGVTVEGAVDISGSDNIFDHHGHFERLHIHACTVLYYSIFSNIVKPVRCVQM